MKDKKVLLALMALVLALGFAACGGKKNSEASSGGGATAQADNAQAGNVQKEYYGEMTYDEATREMQKIGDDVKAGKMTYDEFSRRLDELGEKAGKALEAQINESIASGGKRIVEEKYRGDFSTFEGEGNEYILRLEDTYLRIAPAINIETFREVDNIPAWTEGNGLWRGYSKFGEFTDVNTFVCDQFSSDGSPVTFKRK